MYLHRCSVALQVSSLKCLDHPSVIVNPTLVEIQVHPGRERFLDLSEGDGEQSPHHVAAAPVWSPGGCGERHQAQTEVEAHHSQNSPVISELNKDKLGQRTELLWQSGAKFRFSDKEILSVQTQLAREFWEIPQQVLPVTEVTSRVSFMKTQATRRNTRFHCLSKCFGWSHLTWSNIENATFRTLFQIYQRPFFLFTYNTLSKRVKQ